MAEEPAWGLRRNDKGNNAIAKMDDGKRARMVLCEPQVRQGDEPTLDELRERRAKAGIAEIFLPGTSTQDIVKFIQERMAQRQQA